MFEMAQGTGAGSARATSPLPERPVRISGVMAMDSLREQCHLTNEAKFTYEARMAERDGLIRSARAASIPVAALMRVTNLSRDRIQKIDAQQRANDEETDR